MWLEEVKAACQGYLVARNVSRDVERDDRPGTTPVRTKRFLKAPELEALLKA